MKNLFVAAALALLTLGLATSVVGAQEPLPDLTVEKTGPSEVVAKEFGPQFEANAIYEISLSNVGDAPAVIPAGTLGAQDTFRQPGARAGREWRLSLTSLGGHNLPSQDTPFESILRPLHLRDTEFRRFPAGGFIREEVARTDVVIQPGETLTQTYFLELGKPGRATNCFEGDPDNVVIESNEENNTACVTTEISRASSPGS